MIIANIITIIIANVFWCMMKLKSKQKHRIDDEFIAGMQAKRYKLVVRRKSIEMCVQGEAVDEDYMVLLVLMK